MAALALALVLAAHGAGAQRAPGSGTVSPEGGESAATAIQRAVIEHHARVRALRERYGEEHGDVRAARARLASEVASLRAAHAARGRIDRARVRDWLRFEIADVEARLAELNVTCSSNHVDVRGGQARRAALEEAMRGIERDGRFIPVEPARTTRAAP